MNIGIFDSGFGGLDIMRSIVKNLPQYNFIYLGDSARTPYGSRSEDIIYTYTEEAVKFLFKKNCKLIIIACNSASTEALRKIQQKYLPKNFPDRNVLGVIIPSIEETVKITKNNKIGVIATESSVASKAFEKEIKQLNKNTSVYQKACPLLVPIVEAGEKNNKIIKPILESYLNPLIAKGIDTLILGCTHYGLLENEIKKVFKSKKAKIKIINENKIVAVKLKDYLKRHPEYEKYLTKKSKREFYTTDITDRFQKLGSKFFGKPIKSKKVILT
jgi:glutamate racemase